MVKLIEHPPAELNGLLVLIPAAGGVRSGTSVENISSPLLRFSGGKSFLQQVLDSLENSSVGVTHVRLGVRSRDMPQIDYLLLSRKYRFELQTIACDDTSGPLATTLRLLNFSSHEGKVLVQLGDTLCDFDWNQLGESNFGAVVTSEQSAIRRLDRVRLEDGAIQPLGRHPETGPGHLTSEAGLVGVYWFLNGPYISELDSSGPLESLIFSNSKDGRVRALEARQWVDADYSDRFNEQQSHVFESRSFNRVERDNFGMYVQKSSSDSDKLEREHSYLRGLPESVAGLFPQPRKFLRGNGSAELWLDYWPFPSLSDLYTLQNLPGSFWDSVMPKLKSALEMLHREKVQVSGDLGVWAFGSKTKERVGALKELPGWGVLATRSISINGHRSPRVDDLIDRSLAVLHKSIHKESVVHGDFCFSNILVDPQTLTIKLIDPRGGFQEASSVGPSFYDMAKLSHSLVGGYDSILKGFSSHEQLNETEYRLEIREPPHHKHALSAFISAFQLDLLAYQKLKLGSALILLAIPPLHMEAPDRARQFFLKGLLDANSSLQEITRLTQTDGN